VTEEYNSDGIDDPEQACHVIDRAIRMDEIYIFVRDISSLDTQRSTEGPFMSRPTYELTRCIVCDALDNTEIADDSAMRSEVELLWAFHERRLRPGVPPEHLLDRVVFSQSPPFRLSRCYHCSHLYRNPQERRESLEAAYDTLIPDDLDVISTV
jgi:hypothetical protein